MQASWRKAWQNKLSMPLGTSRSGLGEEKLTSVPQLSLLQEAGILIFSPASPRAFSETRQTANDGREAVCAKAHLFLQANSSRSLAFCSSDVIGDTD